MRCRFPRRQNRLMHFVQGGHRLQHQQINAALRECANLLGKCRPRFFKRNLAQRLYLYADRAHGAGHIGLRGLLITDLIRRLPGNFGARNIYVMHFVLQAVPLQPKSIAAEGVGLDDLRAGLQIFLMDGANQIGLRQVQFVVTTMNEHTAFVQHGAHGAVAKNASCLEQFTQGYWHRKLVRLIILDQISRGCAPEE